MSLLGALLRDPAARWHLAHLGVKLMAAWKENLQERRAGEAFRATMGEVP